MGYSQEQIQRFNEKTELIPFSTCTYWTAAADKHGYGRLGIGTKLFLAHRVAYEIANGPIPIGESGRPLHLRHTCDNPACVNPAHLLPGTQADNMADMRARDRQARDETHGQTKLTKVQIGEALAEMEAGVSRIILAEKYGVAQSYLAAIYQGHVRGVGTLRTGRADRQISDEMALSIYETTWRTGQVSATARLFGVTPTMVSDIKRGVTYRKVTSHPRRVR